MKTDNFDAEDYLLRYPEVAVLGMDPRAHFEAFGKRMGYGLQFEQIKTKFEQGTKADNVEEPILNRRNCDRKASLYTRRLGGISPLDMRISYEDGVPLWVSTGYDPQMLVAVDNQQLELQAGQYLVFLSTEDLDAAWVAPKLYFDFGEGFSEASETTAEFISVPGAPSYCCAFQLDRPTKQIRLDPSLGGFASYVTEFTLEAFEIVRTTTPVLNPAASKINFLERAEWSSAKNVNRYEVAWKNGFGVASGSRSPHYAPLTSISAPKGVNGCQIVAFYLPQFHPIAENDAWWGRGFTEWTNVSKAQPQYVGHNQPRLPGELGFYDLRLPEVMERQIQLAKQFGITGFCFHYYWFGGKRLLERPIEDFLQNKSPAYNFPFCLCWANENWTRRWDGAESDVLMAQDHSETDNLNVFQDLLRFFKDSRYILVDGKPMITIYRPGIITGLPGLVETWRAAARDAGFKDIYLVATNAFGCNDAAAIGFDALVEFPPHGVGSTVLNRELDILNEAFEGQIYDYQEVVDFCTDRLLTRQQSSPKVDYFPTVMAGWDNEARKPGKGNVFHGATPEKFFHWLSSAIDYSTSAHLPGSQFVFVNAWNEWAEGTYLEPDRHFGYAYLNAVSAAVAKKNALAPVGQSFVDSYNRTAQVKSADTAICVHVFYPDLIDEISEVLVSARQYSSFDVVLSLPMHWTNNDIENAIAKLSPVYCILTENVGRDIWPFIQSLRKASELGYQYGCKIHSKKSPHLSNGSRWRKGLYASLFSPFSMSQVRKLFLDSDDIGILAPKDSIATCEDPSTLQDNRENLERILLKFDSSIADMGDFVAGTMFWFKVEAFKILMDGRLTQSDFGPELGAIDGTVAHACERAIPYLASLAGFRLETYEFSGKLNPYKN